MSSGSSSDEESKAKPGKKLVYQAAHSLFVRNLSPDVNEQILRSVFDQDVIEKVSFRAFPNSNTQFFAQIDFKSSVGVTEGSKLSGVPILGVPCEVGVVDPIITESNRRAAAAGSSGSAETGSAGAGTDAVSLEEVNKRITEAAEDQRLRTIHIAGLPNSTTAEKLERLCSKFGDVERLKVDNDTKGACFGLVEFKDRGPAHICKTQRTLQVDGHTLVITEAKTMVEESSFMEQTIQFQAPIIDAMAMKNVLYQQGELRDKLDKVRQAAMSIVSKESEKEKEKAEVTKDTAELEQADEKTEEERQKEKEKKRQAKAEKKENKLKRKMEKKMKKKEKKKKKKLKKKKKRREVTADGGDEEDEEAVDISESPDGPVDLESEVEVVGREFVNMAQCSTSSSSSESSETRAERIAKAIARRRQQRVCLANVVGDWHVVGDPPDLWTVEDDGRLSFNSRKLKAEKWGFVQESAAGNTVLYCKGQRLAGWELNLKASTVDRLIWTKAGEIDTHWLRKGIGKKVKLAKRQKR